MGALSKTIWTFMYAGTAYIALYHGETVTDLIDAAQERESFNREKQRLHIQHTMYLRKLKLQNRLMGKYGDDREQKYTTVEHPIMEEALQYDMHHDLEYSPRRQRRQYMEIIEDRLRKHQSLRRGEEVEEF
mmetsp:Transcript_9845/g.14510  ORF Transcript_9845/g.14510 Transcript_9845/m.14510 type:complete len:131 (-) Transcript_9845:1759-2151(-)